MPKAILEFNLPEENEAYKTATNAIKYYCALWEMSNRLRSASKHEDDASAEKWRSVLYDILNEEGIGNEF